MIPSTSIRVGRIVITISVAIVALVVGLVVWELTALEALAVAIPVSKSTTYVDDPSERGYRVAMEATIDNSLGRTHGWLDEAALDEMLTRVGADTAVLTATRTICQQPWSAVTSQNLAAVTKRVVGLTTVLTKDWPQPVAIRPSLTMGEPSSHRAQRALAAVKILRMLVCEVLREDGDVNALVVGWGLTGVMSQLDSAWYRVATEFRTNLSQAAIRRACADSEFRARLVTHLGRLEAEPLMDPRDRARNNHLRAVGQLVLEADRDGERLLGGGVDRANVLQQFNHEFAELDRLLLGEGRAEQIVERVRGRTEVRRKQASGLKAQSSWLSSPLTTPQQRIAARNALLASAVADVTFATMDDEVALYADAARWSIITVNLGKQIDATCARALEIGARATDPRTHWLAEGAVQEAASGLIVEVGKRRLQL
jgi:hypothetical protein